LKYKIIAIALVTILLVTSYIIINTNTSDNQTDEENLYFGVTADGDVTKTKNLIDKVKDYTNMILILNPEIVKNKTTLNEVCDYSADSGMSFFVHMGHPSYWKYNHNPFEWIEYAQKKYDKNFLGIYLYDEPGGNQIDLGSFREFDKTTMPYDYRDAANTYIYYLYVQMRDFIKTDNIATSDYALYWFDYEAGYDIIMGEFGRDVQKNLTIPLVRGAAELHNKTWGIMITHTKDEPPYIEPPETLYQNMIDAYKGGAKYISVFNYPQIEPYGLLTEEHFDAIKQFNEYIKEKKRNQTSNIQRIAYVLPENYGWGLRNPKDKIWGVWETDNKSQTIWNRLTDMIKEYGTTFDIVFESLWTTTFAKQHYDTLIWWNGTIQQLN
jgi:hypothetical protein